MTQPPPPGPPPGGYPPQGQPPQGQPPQGPPPGGAPQGPPPGQPPAGGYPPPPQGQPPQGPPPGQAPPPPPGPPPGQPPQGGYPPPGQAPGGPPPGAPPPPAAGYGAPPPGQPGYPPQGQQGGGSSFDPSSIAIRDWCLMGAGVLYFIFSFFTWEWTTGGSSTVLGIKVPGYAVWHNGWSSWYIIPTLLVLAVLVITGLRVFVPAVNLSVIKKEYLFYGAALAGLLMIIACIVMLATTGPMYFGAWACLILALGVTYFVWISAQDDPNWKLPVLPKPANF